LRGRHLELKINLLLSKHVFGRRTDGPAYAGPASLSTHEEH
jgi:hypothetical protein